MVSHCVFLMTFEILRLNLKEANCEIVKMPSWTLGSQNIHGGGALGSFGAARVKLGRCCRTNSITILLNSSHRASKVQVVESAVVAMEEAVALVGATIFVVFFAVTYSAVVGINGRAEYMVKFERASDIQVV